MQHLVVHLGAAHLQEKHSTFSQRYTPSKSQTVESFVGELLQQRERLAKIMGKVNRMDLILGPMPDVIMFSRFAY